MNSSKTVQTELVEALQKALHLALQAKHSGFPTPDPIFATKAVVGDNGDFTVGIPGCEWELNFGPAGLEFESTTEYMAFQTELKRLYSHYAGERADYCFLRKERGK